MVEEPDKSPFDTAIHSFFETYLENYPTKSEVEKIVASGSGGNARTEEEILEIFNKNATGGMTEEQVREIAQEESGLDKSEVLKIVESQIGDSSGGASSQVQKEVSMTRRALEFPARRVGPSEPIGENHTYDGWGIHFEVTEHIDVHDLNPLNADDNRQGVAHIGKTKIHPEEDGTITVALMKYDGAEKAETFQTRDIEVTGGEVNEIDLDMVVPEPSQGYLLTRSGTHGLLRGGYRNFAGADGPMDNGLRLVGGSKPGDYDKPNDFWYYFFDLQIASAVHYHS